MQKPITSRVKRSPLLKYSPAKETNNGNVEAIGSQTTEGEDKVEIIKTEKKKNYPTDQQVCHPDYKAKTGKGGPGSKECNAWKNTSDEQKKKAETEVVEEKVVTPGEDKTVDTKLYRKDYQDVKEPWEVRRSNRAAKVAGRSQRRAQNKADKVARQLAKLEEKGVTSGRKYDNLKAKETETTQELENMKQGSLNVAEGRKSGKLAGSRVRRTEDVVKTMGDYEQDDAAQVRMQARQKEIAAQSGMTTGQAAGAIEAGKTAFSGALETAKELGVLDYEAGQYTQGITMKPSAFKMKGKSPATKKLQGAQNTLPQHLQAAIKAAPKRTVLKKSYFKNK